jgi:hypothetical protein
MTRSPSDAGAIGVADVRMARDRQQALPVTLLRAWRGRFVNRPQPYAVQQPDGTYRWIHAPCELEDLAAHLEGEWTLALSSTDRRARCKWLCLDVDAVGEAIMPQLLALRAALAARGVPDFVEASRRGGHLWFLLDRALPAHIARSVLEVTLTELRVDGRTVPPFELYPIATEPGMLGQAVRLPLGIHQLTGRRYPFFDSEGPCAFTTTRAAVQFVLEQPRISATFVRARWAELADVRFSSVGAGDPDLSQSDHMPTMMSPGAVGTRSLVIRWVDREISPLDLLAELAPDTELRQVGWGYLGWCPFHDDRAPDEAGRPGTPSFYVVHDRRHGWSWKCFSTNCPYSWGLLRHPFELFQRLLDLSVRAAIVEACARWPAADTTRKPITT